MKHFLTIAAALLVSASASAQYPQLTEEAKEKLAEMKKAWAAHADSAWAVAEPIVMKEAAEGRP